MSARANYLSADRPDLQFASKELMRWLSCPSQEDNDKLKRLGRYLIGARRLVCKFPWAQISKRVTVYVDSNHAGCLRTRLSTVGGAMVWGSAFLKCWSKTVGTVCLSSGESELAAVVKGGAEGLGIQAVMRDLGYHVHIVLQSDATAAIGMTKRQGLGRARHLAVADLWIQQRVRARHLGLANIPGKENPADLLTKNLSAEHSRYLMHKVGFQFIEGLAAKAVHRATVDSASGEHGEQYGKD